MTTMSASIGENCLQFEYYNEDQSIEDIKFDQVDADELYVRVDGKFVKLSDRLVYLAYEEYQGGGYE